MSGFYFNETKLKLNFWKYLRDKKDIHNACSNKNGSLRLIGFKTTEKMYV